MTDLAAAIGVQQLKKAWGFQRRRSEMAARYDAELADSGVTLPPHPNDGDTHSWHLYVIRLEQQTGINRDEFIERMAARGVGWSVHFIPLHLHPYWRDMYHLQPHHFPLSWQAYRSAPQSTNQALPPRTRIDFYHRVTALLPAIVMRPWVRNYMPSRHVQVAIDATIAVFQPAPSASRLPRRRA